MDSLYILRTAPQDKITAVLPMTAKLTLEQAMKVRREVQVWLYSFFNLGARQTCVINATPLPLYPRYPLYKRLAWVSGPVWTGAGNLATTPDPTGFDRRTVQP